MQLPVFQLCFQYQWPPPLMHFPSILYLELILQRFWMLHVVIQAYPVNSHFVTHSHAKVGNKTSAVGRCQ